MAWSQLILDDRQFQVASSLPAEYVARQQPKFGAQTARTCYPIVPEKRGFSKQPLPRSQYTRMVTYYKVWVHHDGLVLTIRWLFARVQRI